MAKQGWDRADFHCGGCGYKFTTTTEADYVRLYSEHKGSCPATSEQRASAAVLRAIANTCQAVAAAYGPRWTARSLIAELRASADRIEGL